MNIQNTFNIVEIILSDKRIKASDISVLFALISHMGTKGYCYPAVQTLAEETGYSDRAVQLSTNRLERFGYIGKVYRKGYGRQYSNYYCLNNQENISQKKDGELKEVIEQDEEYMEFAGKFCTVDKAYKLECMNYVQRNLKVLDKRECTFLLYALLKADREAMLYFTTNAMADKLSMAYSRIVKIMDSLQEQKIIQYVRKNIKGEEINLVRINIENLNYRVQFMQRMAYLIHMKSMMINLLSIFYEESDYEVKIEVFLFAWKVLYIIDFLIKIFINIQALERHSLYDQNFSP
ncbi:MAG: helix-turn-helix domain-containing protein [Eubacterium sp.]|nr:helix-turn-helix domain-containing protein [Eubacterium sp.]